MSTFVICLTIQKISALKVQYFLRNLSLKFVTFKISHLKKLMAALCVNQSELRTEKLKVKDMSEADKSKHGMEYS